MNIPDSIHEAVARAPLAPLTTLKRRADERETSAPDSGRLSERKNVGLADRRETNRFAAHPRAPQKVDPQNHGAGVIRLLNQKLVIALLPRAVKQNGWHRISPAETAGRSKHLSKVAAVLIHVQLDDLHALPSFWAGGELDP